MFKLVYRKNYQIEIKTLYSENKSEQSSVRIGQK